MSVLRLATERRPLPIYGRVVDVESAERDRRLHCKRYNVCLTFAVKNGWPGFLCTSCDAFEVITRDEFFRDAEGMSDMIARMAEVAFSREELALMGYRVKEDE